MQVCEIISAVVIGENLRAKEIQHLIFYRLQKSERWDQNGMKIK